MNMNTNNNIRNLSKISKYFFSFKINNNSVFVTRDIHYIIYKI